MAFNFLASLITEGDQNPFQDDSGDFYSELDDAADESDIDEDYIVHNLDNDSDNEQEEDTGHDAQGTGQWSEQLHPISVDEFTERTGPPEDLTGLQHASTYDYFIRFIPENYFEELANQTNIYAYSKNPTSDWKDATPDDMKRYFFINIMFGIHQMSEYKDYWSTDELLAVPCVSSIMSRRRFELLSRFFPLNDNTNQVAKGEPNYDPIFKVRPLYDLIRQTSMENYMPERDIAFDEAMIAFTGRLSFKQYIKNKPSPWGIKMWCAAESKTGYLLDFNVYTGKSNNVSNNGLGYDVVMTLGRRFLDRHHLFYFDNLFAFVKLATDLLERGTYSCATIRSNKKGYPKDIVSKRKGVTKIRQIGNLVATFWFDKRPVNVLSTNADPTMTRVTRRAPGGPIEKEIPTSVDIYNRRMGGVDLHDQYRAYYPVGRRSRKWWRCLVWFFLQVAIINAYQLYSAVYKRAVTTNRKLTPKQFRLGVFRGLREVGSCRAKAAAETVQEVRGERSCHPVCLQGRKKACFQCRQDRKHTSNGRAVESVYGCSRCQVHLCQGTCFAKFHRII